MQNRFMRARYITLRQVCKHENAESRLETENVNLQRGRTQY